MITTWQMAKFVKVYFGGKLTGERVRKGHYRFVGENNKVVDVYDAPNAAFARGKLGRHVANVTGETDKRINRC